MNDIYKILFLDIETVPMYKNFNEISENLQKYWTEKADKITKNSNKDENIDYEKSFFEKAAIYAEFGRIVCISVGFILKEDNKNCFRVKSFANEDEKVILNGFKKIVEKFIANTTFNFCGHNIKEFDIPYICRRMIVNKIELPKQLNFANKKPWEINVLDTLDFWKFGDYKNYTSLKLLTEILGIPTPKDDIDGSQVATVFYQQNDLSRISTYCEKDVVATMQVWLRLNGLENIEANNIEHVK